MPASTRLNCLHNGREDRATSFVALLRDCAKHKDLYIGSLLHDDIVKEGFLKKCSNALVTMYAKCGALAKAQGLLDVHKCRDVFTWTALISGYAQKGEGQSALDCFEKMQREGISVDAVTLASVLKACGSIQAADKGEKIHDEIARQGLLRNDNVLGNVLVDMYVKCGALAKARQALADLPARDVVSWSALIAGYAQHDEGEEALQCYEQMQRERLSPDAVTLACILKACGSVRAIEKGEKIHDEVVRQGLLENNIALGNALVDMYAKCGALTKAQQVLEELPVRDVVSWSALIGAYASQGQGAQALKCFELMQREGLSPNAVTFASILKACGSLRAADKGEKFHDEIIRQGLLGNNIVLSNALVDMYAKCGALAKAWQVLHELPSRDLISWNALIAGYAEESEGEHALHCFEQMQCEGVFPDEKTFASILKACSSIGAADKGEKIHDELIRHGLLGKDIVLGNALVNMYAKSGALSKAQQVLEELPTRDLISWSALVAGYAQQDKGEQALMCYEKMQSEGFFADASTYACVLKACGSVGAADKGQNFHDEIVQQGLLGDNIVLGNALVDMYAKCGALSKAGKVLEELPARDVVSWSALIGGYAQQGQSEQALNFLERMQCEGILPDAALFSCVLSACSLSGLVEDAQMYLALMESNYGMKPSSEHYACMVDIFARAGHLDRAAEVIEKVPSSCSEVWSSLLCGCLRWGDVNVGRWAFEHAIQVDQNDAAVYMMMANIYTAAGMHEDAKDIEALGTERTDLNELIERLALDIERQECGS